jgi:hypothetical protein
MTEFLTAILSFPTVVFTVMLIVIVLYWLMVIVGAIGVDVLHIGEAAGGKIEGMLGGAIEGAGGKIEGAVEARVEGSMEGVAHGAGGFLAMLGFGKVPATVVISSLVLWSWALCLLAVKFGAGLGLPAWALQPAAPLVGVFLGGVLTGVLVRIAGRFLVHHEPLRSGALVGKLCTVTTGRVDANFGQAQFSEDGNVITIEVRCDPPNSLLRHAQAVILTYDPEHHIYTVEAYDQPLAPLGERPPAR